MYHWSLTSNDGSEDYEIFIKELASGHLAEQLKDLEIETGDSLGDKVVDGQLSNHRERFALEEKAETNFCYE